MRVSTDIKKMLALAQQLNVATFEVVSSFGNHHYFIGDKEVYNRLVKDHGHNASVTFFAYCMAEVESIEHWYEKNPHRKDWLMLTPDEAEDIATKAVKSRLWEGNPKFLLDFLGAYTTNADKAITRMQIAMGADCNDLIILLLGDKIDKFIDHVIDTEGRGPHLSKYDNKEHTHYILDSRIFLYKQA
ncbi:MAG: hypothetical protein EHM20_10870 [Alphaproteobacteria bacterium]|nr:MAG: hypothetical protein EHM20_10870 [Alphaproteobacteria bacterium]